VNARQPIPPSGEQLEIALGEQRAAIVEVGAGLRSYSVAGRDVLDGYGADEVSLSGRGQLLIPWPNRIQDGSYEFDGRRHQLALTEPAARNAIHGLVRWVPWRVAAREPQRVVLEHVLHPQPGYPFSLALAVAYSLTERGLEVRTSATNVGRDTCPYGAGAHPYLSVGTPTVDPLILRVPAQRVLESDERGLPTGTKPVNDTDYDFREPRPVGSTKLDNCFTGLDRNADGLALVELQDPASGRALTLWVDGSYEFLMVFTGDARPDVARRSVAVEPMTCPPNAFRSGQAVIRLEPGESHASSWGIEPAGFDAR
jgi:aldose 1-epimerase